jgi:Carboxypeptidase regulatory-like domain
MKHGYRSYHNYLGDKTFSVLCSATARCTLTFFLCLILLSGSAWGQVGAATLSGIVLDQTGAVVPEAQVILHNNQTGAERTVRSNGAGNFTFASIPSGDYKVTISHTGFESLIREAIHLDAGDNKTVPEIKLPVGSATESVTVLENALSIPLDNGQLSSTISSSEIAKLSVTGREATELLRTLPGFAIRSTDSSNTAPDFSQVQLGQQTPYASNGSPVAGVTLMLDGANLTDAGNFGANVQNINYSFISEVQVQTSNFGADQSNGPVLVTGVTRAGTSSYHGSAYIIARTGSLNSTDALAKANGIVKPNDRYLYPGVTFSGPVPHLRKLTFFGGAEYDAQRNIYAYNSSSSSIIHALVPTAAMRSGDFSAASIAQYLGPQLTNGGYANLNSVPTFGKNGSALTNGNIASFLDPGALALVKSLLPLPTMATNSDGYNYTAQNLVNNNVFQTTGRIDYAATPHDSIFVRYTYEKEKQGQPQIPYYSPGAPMGSINTPGGGVLNNISVHSGAANYVHIFSPTLTNELFATMLWFTQSFDAKDPNALLLSTNNYPYQAAYNNGTKDIPELQDYGIDGLPVALYPDYSFGSPSLKKVQPTGGDNLTKVWGVHTIKGGVFGQRITNNQTITNGFSNGAIGDYFFPSAGTTFTDSANKTYSTSGNYLANFLEGEVQQVFQQNFLPRTNLYYWNVGFYAQDTWRVRPNFVLDYGVRFEHLGAWTDAHGLGAAVWEPSTYANSTSPLPGFLWHDIDKSIPNSGTGSTPLFVEPRVGFSWDITGKSKTILRGGVGSYRMHDSIVDVTNAFANSEGLRTDYEFGNGGNTLAGVSTLKLPITAGGLSTQAFGLDPNDHTDGIVNNYSLSLVQTLPRNSFVQISYVGNNANSLLNNSNSSTVSLNNLNALPLGALYKPHPAGVPCAASICTPQEVTSLSATSIQAFRPYTAYQGITVPEHIGYSNYNGVQVVYQKQAGRLNYNFNYTFGKALGILGSAADFNWTAPLDPTGIYKNYGVLNFDRSQVFNATYSYSVGRMVHGPLGYLANDWLISGITNVQSGGDFQGGISVLPNFGLAGTIGNGTNSYQVNAQTILGTPDISLQPTLKCNPRSNLVAHQYINGACFGVPNIGTNGQYFYPYVHGPAFVTSDLTAEKGFSLGGERSIKFRVAAFNFLNHPLTSFVPQNANEVNLNLSDTSSNASTATASFDPTSGFGFAPYKQGRRLVQLSGTFSF